jgi:CubicO group peptidase (beta-lactamase class C family)
MKKIIPFLLFNLLVVHVTKGQDEASRIDSLLTKNTADAEFCGSLLVAKGKRIILKKGYGYSHEKQKIPNDENTVFNIASITKTFTAALILKLQEQGKLSVSDVLSKYYPGYPGGDKITIHHLLTHTAGIPDYLQQKEFQVVDQSKPVALEKMIAFFKDKPLLFEPGTAFRYSNSDYTLLGYIIEKITGATYATALENYIFKPLHLNNTSYGPPQSKSLNTATGYVLYYKNFQRASLVVDPSISYATGAIYSTVNDLYKWHCALQTNKFLSKRSLSAAYTRDKGPYGYGWFTDSLYGRQRVSHDGNIPGFKSNINRFPQDDICVIALSNANNSGVGGIVRNVVNIVYHQPLTKSFADQPVIQLTEEVKKEYTGTYKWKKEDTVQAVVYLKDSNLFMTLGNQPAFEILPVFKDVFKAGEARIEFKRNKEQHVSEIWMFNKGEMAQVSRME